MSFCRQHWEDFICFAFLTSGWNVSFLCMGTLRDNVESGNPFSWNFQSSTDAEEGALCAQLTFKVTGTLKDAFEWSCLWLMVLLELRKTLPQPLITSFWFPWTTWSQHGCSAAKPCPAGCQSPEACWRTWGMTLFFLNLVAQFCLVLQLPTGSQLGAEEEAWAVTGRWRRIKSAEAGNMSKGVQHWGWNFWKNGFYCKLFVPWCAFSLTAYFSHLKLVRCCEVWGHLPLLPTHSHWHPSE